MSVGSTGSGIWSQGLKNPVEPEKMEKDFDRMQFCAGEALPRIRTSKARLEIYRINDRTYYLLEKRGHG